MLDWLDEVAGPGYAQAVLWTLLALLLLVVLLIVIKLVRSMTHGTFVAGGRNRKARLAVTDAAAIDSHRRLVLIRRDDVEHLLLIGGSTDIVIEHDIRIGQPRRVPSGLEALREPAVTQAAPPHPASPAQSPAPQRQRMPEPPRPQQTPRPATERPATPTVPRQVETLPPRPIARQDAMRADVQRPQPPELRVEPRMAPSPQAPSVPAVQAPAPRVKADPPPASTNPLADDLDSALLKELEVSLDHDTPAAKPSLDDEMSRLLGELSNPRR